MNQLSPAPRLRPEWGTPTTTSTPRARRGAAAVIAQYIQDLTHPADDGPCPATA